MGSSRASTPAGRRRTARRTAAGKAPARRASAPKRSAAAKRPASAKRPARKTAPKARKAPPRPKPKAKRKPAAPRTLAARVTRILAIGLVLAAALAAGYMLWFRNSSFVAVEKVSITGMSGPERAAVEDALRRSAREMTTLNVDDAALDAAVAGFPTVVGVEADASFPHDLAITVEARPPALLVTAGKRSAPVAGDGTILTGVDTGAQELPSIALGEIPAQGALTGEGLEIARVMGAAPVALRQLVEEVSYGGTEGVEVVLEGGIPVYFGPGDHAAEKWQAAAAILADPEIDTLTYVDVRVPDRPSLGGAAPAVSATTTDAIVPESEATTAVTP
jgi:cell division septal protein FtsQ